MKPVLLFFLVLSVINAKAQKDFEGMIIYEGKEPAYMYGIDMPGTTDSIKVNIYFTKGKIMVRNFGKPDNEDMLILIDSAKVYMINNEEKSYSIKKLRRRVLQEPAKKEIIAGYSTTPLESFGVLDVFGGMNMNQWFADSLFYHIPKELEWNSELLMIKNNKILLKAAFTIDTYSWHYREEYEQESEPDTSGKYRGEEFLLVATQVIPGPVSPAEFIIPGDFTQEPFQPYVSDTTAVMDMDTTMMMMDSVISEPVQKKLPQKPKNNLPKQPVKNSSDNKAAIKKEE